MKVMNHMNYESIKPATIDRKAYINFMCNPNNSHNCKECPERESGNNGGLPCGQQQCWVDVTCKDNE